MTTGKMKKFMTMSAYSFVGMTVALMVPAFAATTAATATISAGSLSVTAPSIQSTFPALTLNGQTQQIKATLGSWQVVDATGTGDGWHVDLQASQLTEAAPSGGWASGTSAKIIPLGSLALSGTRSVTAGSGSTAVNGTGGPLLQNQSAPIDVSTPVQILDTQANYGMGTYTITEPSGGLTLTLQPATSYTDPKNYPSSATPYTTTLSYSVVSSP